MPDYDDEATYEDKLPSVHLDEEDLRDLNKLLTEERVPKENVINIKSGELQRKFEDIEEILTKPTLDNHIYSMSWRIEYEEGFIEINYDGTGFARKSILIEGNSDWVKLAKEDLNTFFDQKENKILTYAKGGADHYVLGVSVVTLSALITSLSFSEGKGSFSELLSGFGFFEYVLSGSILLVAVSIMAYLENEPYFVINLEGNHLHPNFVRAIKAITIFGSIASIVSLILVL